MNIEMDLDLAFLAERLKFLRRVHELTQDNVATICGMTTRSVEKLPPAGAVELAEDEPFSERAEVLSRFMQARPTVHRLGVR